MAEWLRTERAGKQLSRGSWELDGANLQLWLNSPALVNGRRSTFAMRLLLSSTVEGRNNRLSVEQYHVQFEVRPAVDLMLDRHSPRCAQGQEPSAMRVEISKFLFARLPQHLL